jgi:hypothetical protein
MAAEFCTAAMVKTSIWRHGEMRPIIGLCGPEGSGKTTVADWLVERFGYAKESFAKPLKQMIEVFGVPEKYIYGSQEDKEQPLDILCGRSARYAMRTLGTEWGRDIISPQIWVHHWKRRAYGRLVVCDDVRFHNEVDAIHEMNGIVIRIEGRGVEKGEHSSDHSSELDVDAVVVNDRSLWELFDAVIKAAS